MPYLPLTGASMLLLLLAACGEFNALYEEPTPAPVQEVLWDSCANPEAGYTIDYPQEWHTNADGCQLFDPGPVTVSPDSDELPLDVAVAVRVEPVAFRQVVADDSGLEVVSTEDVEVDQHPAVRQELVATGEAAFPDGTRLTRYVADRNGETLIAETADVGGPSYEYKVQVLDEMVSELEFTDDG